MTENKLQSPHHNSIRLVLRVGGPIIAAIGLIFVIIGMASFFSSFGTFNTPQYFWCAFVGLPLVFVGVAMSMFGYMGAAYRYVAGETAPVVKDAVNYLGEGVQPGVKAVAKAATEGVREGMKEQPKNP